MPPVPHPFKKGALVILMNYNDHASPHVHVKYQGDVGSYRLEIRTRTWLKPGKELPSTLRKWWKRGWKRTNKSCSNSGRTLAIISLY